MSLPVRLRRAVQAEYDDAADWYEARRRDTGRLREVDLEVVPGHAVPDLVSVQVDVPE